MLRVESDLVHAIALLMQRHLLVVSGTRHRSAEEQSAIMLVRQTDEAQIDGKVRSAPFKVYFSQAKFLRFQFRLQLVAPCLKSNLTTWIQRWEKYRTVLQGFCSAGMTTRTF